jgi:hypothetical protein
VRSPVGLPSPAGDPSGRHPTRSRAGWIRALLGLILLAVVASDLSLLAGRSESSGYGGPLADRTGTVSRVTLPIRTGREATVTMRLPELRGDELAVLVDVGLLAPTRGLRLVEAHLWRCRRETFRGRPPARCLDPRPVAGLVVKPGTKEFGLGLILRADRPGVNGAPGLFLDYRVGRSRFRAFYTQGVVVCRGQRNASSPACLHRGIDRLEADLYRLIRSRRYPELERRFIGEG